MSDDKVKITITRGGHKWSLEFPDMPEEGVALVSGTITPEDFIEGRTLDIMALMAVVAALRSKGMQVGAIMDQVRQTIARYDRGEFRRLGKGVEW